MSFPQPPSRNCSFNEASVSGRCDDLRGLKENVIVGRLIPAGTGTAYADRRKTQQQQSQQRTHLKISKYVGKLNN
ncbi:MAG: hypothetical protein R3E08_09205 [Thiotrichaceae bacterium]